MQHSTGERRQPVAVDPTPRGKITGNSATERSERGRKTPKFSIGMDETDCGEGSVSRAAHIDVNNDDDDDDTEDLPSSKKSRKFKKAPGAPKRFRSAFIFFSQQKHKEIQESLAKTGGSEKTTSVAKMVSEAWRSMEPEERSMWEKMASEDKERFEKERAQYRGPWTVPIGHRKSKDPSAPKRPASAFLAFSNSRRASVKKENKEASNADISRILSKMWKEAPESVRKTYCEAEAEERKRYKERIADWRENNQTSNKRAKMDSVEEIHEEAPAADPILSNADHPAPAASRRPVGNQRQQNLSSQIIPDSSTSNAVQRALSQLNSSQLASAVDREQARKPSDLIRQQTMARTTGLGNTAAANQLAAAQENLILRSLSGSLANDLRFLNAGIQNQNELLERQRQMGIAGMDSLLATLSSQSNQLNFDLDGRRPLAASLQESLRREDNSVQPSILTRQQADRNFFPITSLNTPILNAAGIQGLLNPAVASLNHLSVGDQGRGLQINQLSPSMMGQSGTLSNSAFSSLLLQRRLQQQDLEMLQAFQNDAAKKPRPDPGQDH